MKYFPLLFSLFWLAVTSISAQTMISFQDAEKYDVKRYADIKGSAYLFKDFVDGYITGVDGVIYDKVSINYNGYEEAFEIKQGDQFITLDEKYYSKIKIVEEGKDTMTFIRGVHPIFKGRFIELIYRSDNATVVRRHYVGLSETEVNNIGRKEEFKRFLKKTEIRLATGTGSKDIKTLKLNKKKLL
ncbi:MAG: hypothetical protein AAF242_16355, partial [Bacteroidota bacterium]